MNDQQYFLANAYLDGELTAEERRIAEADPEVMTEVELLRALQSRLRDAPAPTDRARESAIATAMAEFSAVQTDSASSARSTDTGPELSTVPFRPRPAYAKYLGIAAAVVAVAGLGIIVSVANRGDDDSSGDAASVAEVTTESGAALTEAVPAADDSAEALAESEMVGGDGIEDAVAAARDEAAESDMMEQAAEVPADDVSTGAADVAADAGEAATAPVPSERWPVPPEFDAEAPITDEMELGIYGAYLLDERDLARLPPSPNTTCGGIDEILDRATVVLDEVRTPVYISVIQPAGLVFARNTATCDVVLSGSFYVN